MAVDEGASPVVPAHGAGRPGQVRSEGEGRSASLDAAGEGTCFPPDPVGPNPVAASATARRRRATPEGVTLVGLGDVGAVIGIPPPVGVAYTGVPTATVQPILLVEASVGRGAARV